MVFTWCLQKSDTSYKFICTNNHIFSLNTHQLKYSVSDRSVQNVICSVCHEKNNLDKADVLIKSIYEFGSFLDAQFININHKHSWHCGVDSHPPFKQSFEKLQSNGLSSACKVCCPRKNKQRTVTDKLEFAQSQNNKFTAEGGKVELLNDQTQSNSRTSDVWSCSNAEHKPFFGSIDNLRRRDQWCPTCTGRIVKKVPVFGVDYN